ncbi:ComF family protein [Umezakia ovalisporum]|jgi:ComF family protein|uniref:ComF family protein n=1 Tax=Umezakia ovalisporum TaxID=75695 RepID=UPI0006F04D9D|nr:ComF family protein [Umezakia ovalisporum]MBI1241998.1 ComF family protein [Nostoc sp. RI_552]MDH6085062.1 ComF family protein [Umezakia ovalisporum TAC611]MDH6088433.1 ComF family protein [Umezakia ovalisporum Ak1311]CEJ45850.1 Competence protein F-like, phosphoribosyltransfer ase domain protein YhgH required for utilization of DNA as sole source of carbon and energy [Umezakia ovalisporum]
MPTWKQNFDNFFNLFLQSNCPLCQRPTSSEFCPYCTQQLKNCQHKDPTALWQQPIPVFGWGIYDGILKRAIAMMKYDNQPQIARPLGQWLGEAWLLSNLSNCKQTVPLVIPIPLHPNKQKKRGYNQAALIAESFCQTTGLKLRVNGLKRVQDTKAQFGLSVSERESNLAEAFAVGEELRNCRLHVPVLLVDDIYTTGATTRSAVKILNENGIAVFGLLAVTTAVKDKYTKS